MSNSNVFIIKQDKRIESETQGICYRDLLNNFFRGIEVPFEPNDLIYLNGKPILRNGYYLSVTKTVLSIFLGICKDEIGIDAESFDSHFQIDGIHNFLHENEISFSSNNRNFATVWTRKESLFKIIGTEFLNYSRLFDCSKNYIIFRSHFTFTDIILPNNIILTVCSRNPKTKIRIMDQKELQNKVFIASAI